MEIAIKGVLGALVAILLHLATTSKHYYLSGLIPLFPTFALFAHTMFASSGRTADMLVSAQFGMLSLIPYGVYLLLAWLLAARLNVWLALTVATMGWAAAATIIIVLWNRGSDWIASTFNGPLCIALATAACICTWFATRHRAYGRRPETRGAQAASAPSLAASPGCPRRWSVAMGSVSSIALAVGAVYMLRSHMGDEGHTEAVESAHTAQATVANHQTRVAALERQEDTDPAMASSDADLRGNMSALFAGTDADAAGRLIMPPKDDAWEQFNAVLDLDPNSSAARQCLQCMLASSVALAKSATAAGKPHLAATYLAQARSIVFGFRVPLIENEGAVAARKTNNDK